VAAELRPGHLLDQFFQRADAARQRHERVGALEHQALALVHVARDDDFLRLPEHHLAGLQEVRDDAGDLAAMVDDRFGDRAHQADRAAAINQADVVLGQYPAKCAGGFNEFRVTAGSRTAINANSLQSAHWIPCGPGARERQGGVGGVKPRRVA
jgi:hypothetical protein